MRHTTKAGAVIETLLILAGLALLGKAGMVGASTFKFTGSAEHTDGVVSAILDKGFTADVEFTADQGAAIVFAQTGPFFSAQIGGRVPVIYDPENPTRAMVDEPSALWFVPFVLSVCGFLILIFGFRMRAVRNL